MTVRSFFSALGFVVVVASSSTVGAQMTGYPNNGGRLPGTVTAGPQFPGAAAASTALPASPNYGAQPTYSPPPLRSYSPPRGTDPLNGAPAVSYGTPIGGPIAQGAAQPTAAAPAVATPASGPTSLPISTPLPTPVVSAPVATSPLSNAPTLAPPLNAAPTYTPPTYTPPVVQSPTYVPPQATAPVVVSQTAPTGAPNRTPMTPPAVPTLAPQTANTLPTPSATVAQGSTAYVAPPVYGGYNTPNTYTPPTPDFSTPQSIPFYNPSVVTNEMPAGKLTQQEISPFAHGTQPPKYSAWLPRMWKPAPTPVFDNTPANSNYGATYPNESSTAQSGCGPCNSTSLYGSCGAPSIPEPWYANFAAISALEAFKTPMDLDGLNANFGKRVGAIGSFPICRHIGLGGQVSSTAAWYDWKGSQYTGDQTRFQNFNTVGLFLRSCQTGLGFGIAHDWLYDDYYAQFHMSQFRVATSWEINCNNEIGFWGALPQRRDSAYVGTPAVYNQFQSLLQGNLYWKHYWSDCAWASTYVGAAESPSDISYGANVQVAVSRFVAVTGAATYVLPGSGGSEGRQEEIWNLSVGFLFYPGTAMAAQRSQFRPMFAPADNGNFATWRR